MPKYLLQASYSAEGIKGLMKDSASGRRAAVKAALKSVGGKIDSMHFSFGADDVVLVVDMPDNIAAIRMATTVGASGLVNLRTVPLLTVEEMDKALAKGVKYAPPGSGK